jgi:hypothetical protein
MDDVLAGATVIVNATVEPLPLNVSVRNATLSGVLPMYAITVPLLVQACFQPQAILDIAGLFLHLPKRLLPRHQETAGQIVGREKFCM